MTTRAHNVAKKVNGWASTNVFGTREFYAGGYLLRAAGALARWGGNDTVEAIYSVARVGADGQHLPGAHRYTLTLTFLPPAEAFWSLTMYDTSYDGTAGYLVENPISRYMINSTSQGLVFGDNGSLTITIQHDQPEGAAERANWLPAPEGLFYVVMLIYCPESNALDGSWNLPPVLRVG